MVGYGGGGEFVERLMERGILEADLASLGRGRIAPVPMSWLEDGLKLKGRKHMLHDNGL